MKEVLPHFAELRNRIIFCLVFFLLAFAVSYVFAAKIFYFLALPLSGTKMIYTNLTEGFFTYLKVAYFTALFVSIPFFLYQLWKFISAGLYKNEKRAVAPFIFFAPFLFYLGAAFVYFVLMPNAWEFFLKFQSEQVELTAKISEYLSLVMKLIIAFGLCFELPIVLGLLVRLNVLTIKQISKTRKYFIILAFVLGAVLTPPDIISQLFLAFVILLLFEVSLLFLRIFK